MNKPVTDTNAPRTSPLAGQVIAENFAGWSAEIRQEFADDAENHQVGSVLLSETDEVKGGASGSHPANGSRRTDTCWTTSGPRSPTESACSTTTTAPPAASSTELAKLGTSPSPVTSTSSTTCTTTAQANWPSSRWNTRANGNRADDRAEPCGCSRRREHLSRQGHGGGRTCVLRCDDGPELPVRQWPTGQRSETGARPELHRSDPRRYYLVRVTVMVAVVFLGRVDASCWRGTCGTPARLDQRADYLWAPTSVATSPAQPQLRVIPAPPWP